jgi:hypothetical protein
LTASRRSYACRGIYRDRDHHKWRLDQPTHNLRRGEWQDARTNSRSYAWRCPASQLKVPGVRRRVAERVRFGRRGRRPAPKSTRVWTGGGQPSAPGWAAQTTQSLDMRQPRRPAITAAARELRTGLPPSRTTHHVSECVSQSGQVGQADKVRESRQGGWVTRYRPTLSREELEALA